MVTPSRRREVVSYLRTAYDVSERRVCRAVGMSRASYRYRAADGIFSILLPSRSPESGEL